MRLHSLAIPFISACFLFTTPLALAQDPINPTNTGQPANGVFSGTDIESVQVGNGNLHIDIPAWSVKGRGLDTSVHFIYDNKGWSYTTSCGGPVPICTDNVQLALGNDLLPPIRRKVYMILRNEEEGYVEGKAQ